MTEPTGDTAGRRKADHTRDRTRLGAIGYRMLWHTGRLIARLYWRMEVVGADRIPDSGAFVIAPVHRSNLDFFLAGLPVRQPVRYMAKSSIFLGGLADRFLFAMGAFPVERDTADFRSIRTCEAYLAAGEPVVVFPEGRRKEGPTIEALFDGPAFVACRQRVPVLPVGIGGSDRAMPIGTKFIFPRKIVLVIGEPIYPDVDLVGRVPRSDVTELTQRMRVELQRLYDESKRLAG